MTALDRAPVPERDIPQAERAAMRAMLVRQVAAPAPGRPARTRWTRPRLLLAASLPLAAIIAAVIALWPLPAHNAFASWTAAPQPLDPRTATRLGQACVFLTQQVPSPPRGGHPAPTAGWHPLLVDRRGSAAVALAVAPPDNVSSCMFLGLTAQLMHLGNHSLPVARMQGGIPGVYAPRGHRVITVENISGAQCCQGPGATSAELVSYLQAYGQVAPAVTRVVIVLDDGTKVQASIHDGWYLAWWPGKVDRTRQSHVSDEPWPVTINAYDSSGRLLQHLQPHRQ